ncbi:MAG TPA: DNA-processing protein DprA [Trichocoleus sp.]
MVNERAYWLAWSRLRGIGPVLLKRIYEHFGSLAIAWDAPAHALKHVDGLGNALVASVLEQRVQVKPETLLANHEETCPYFWTPIDPDYPALLWAIADPPPVLYYRGRTELIRQIDQGTAVGIVGTRSPSDYGKRWTRKLTQRLVQHSIPIVSGLAEGVDREAHLSTLDLGGETLAVLGTGVDVIYPWSNRGLYERIKGEGLLLSEYPDGTGPDRSHFPRRNRIIAGLCRAILVTEAPIRSGALITARLANEYGREVYALPGSLDNPRCLGCLGLVNEGANLILDEETLLKGLGTLPTLVPTVTSPEANQESSSLPPLDPLLEQVFQAIPLEPTNLDSLAERGGLPTGTLLSALVQLELLGLIQQLPGMQYKRS